MIIDVARSLLATIVLFASVAARAETPAPGPGAATTPPASAAQPLQPPAPPPKETPPPPATQAPPPPHAQPIEPPAAATAPRPPAPTAPPPAGRWVYTRQYAWLWMPYAQAYTYVVPDAATAYMFVYYPAFGWRWVVGAPAGLIRRSPAGRFARRRTAADPKLCGASHWNYDLLRGRSIQAASS